VPFRLDSAIAVLSRTPVLLDHWLRGLPSEWLTANEGADTWSPFDVVGHLIDGEEADWMPRARIILGKAADRRFEPFDRFGHIERNRARTLDSLLDAFTRLRRKNLADLEALHLTATELSRTGEHPEFGTVTLEQLLATWVAHDLGHVAQIARVMAKCYSREVGPWRRYLPILNPR
jgi:hypothetical protein